MSNRFYWCVLGIIAAALSLVSITSWQRRLTPESVLSSTTSKNFTILDSAQEEKSNDTEVSQQTGRIKVPKTSTTSHNFTILSSAAAQEKKPRDSVSSQEESNPTKVPKSSKEIAVKQDVQNNTDTAAASPSLTIDHHSRRPLFLLHIGPHKTATSTIQCELTYLKEILHNSKNAYEYLGRVYGECFASQSHPFIRYTMSPRTLLSCLDRHDPKKRPCDKRSEWKAFESLLESLAKSRRNVVMSDEAFSRLRATDANLELFNSTLSKHFRVVVVVVYRRYYEWVLSMYNEKYKPLQRRERYQKWPDEKHGMAMRTFPDYYRRVMSDQGIGGYQLAAEKADLHAVEYLKQVFGKRFDDVRIFNMHQQSGSLLTNFADQLMPDVTKEMLKKLDGHSPKRPNPSMNLDHDLIAVAAHENGLLRKSIKRFEVSMMVARVLSKQSSNYTASLPRECLTADEETAILNRSLAFERHVFPGDETIDASKQHETAFTAASRDLKFCNVDANALLENSAWKNFFRSI